MSNSKEVTRMDYAYRHADRYQQWCYEVERSPFSNMAKAEFAIISAHTRQEFATEGFLAVQREHSVESIGRVLAGASVFAPFKKAGWIWLLRERVANGEDVLPELPFVDWRMRVKINGLGLIKSSFAAALSDPLHSDVLCLDTHMCRAVDIPYRSVMRSSNLYRSVEAGLDLEACEVGLPLFAFQWATWDFMRRDYHQAADDHSFLWRGGRTKYQIKMFT